MAKPLACIKDRYSALEKIALNLNRQNRRGFRLFSNFPNYDYHTVIDIGAFRGEFTDLALAILKPQRVIMVEADPASAQLLSDKYRKVANCKVVHGAMTDRSGPVSLRVNSARDSSSILPIAPITEEIFQQKMQEVELVRVSGLTLDELFETMQIDSSDLIKVDIQGAERLMIEGGRSALSKVRSLYIEVSFEEFYEGSPLFNELDSLLRDCRFKLRSFHECRIGSDNCLAYANALYLKI